LENGYVPSGPYVIKSGKRKGKSLENLMFDDFLFLRWFLDVLNKKHQGGQKNEMHRHLEWLMHQGTNRKPVMLCPQCGQRPVTRFSMIRYSSGISIGTIYTCCDNDHCKDEIDAMAISHTYQLYPFSFAVLKTINVKFDCKELTDLFRKAFGLEGRLTKEKAFAFFAKD